MFLGALSYNNRTHVSWEVPMSVFTANRGLMLLVPSSERPFPYTYATYCDEDHEWRVSFAIIYTLGTSE